MNKYQKLLNKNVELHVIFYNNTFKDIPELTGTFRWHRCLTRFLLKTDKENNIEDLKRLNVDCRETLSALGL